MPNHSYRLDRLPLRLTLRSAGVLCLFVVLTGQSSADGCAPAPDPAAPGSPESVAPAPDSPGPATPQPSPTQAAAAASGQGGIPEGKYICYIIRSRSNSTSVRDIDIENVGYSTQRAGHLNVHPGQEYDWFGNAESRGRYSYDPATGLVQWQSGVYADGKTTARYQQKSGGTDVLLVRFQINPNLSLLHSCTRSTS